MTETSSPYPNRAYAWYVVIVLLFILSSSFVDRSIISLLVGPIRRDLDISDTAFSLLQGLAFAMLYASMGLPFGLLGDRYSRRSIILGGVGFWSFATMGCGLARTFGQLFAARVSVGVGEASLAPSAISLITDYFPKDRLATALNVYQFGAMLGQGLALIIGGTVIQAVSTADTVAMPLLGVIKPWQAAFVVVGLPGLLLALVMLTVREPVRRGIKRQGGMSLREAVAYMMAQRKFYLPLILGVSLATMVNFSLSAWVPAMLMRRFDWSQSYVGQTYGTVILVSGAIGAIGGGNLGDWLVKRGDITGHVKMVALIFVILTPFVVAAALVPSGTVVLILLGCIIALFGATPGLTGAIMQSATPNEARGKVIAIYTLIGAVFGYGIGPTLIAGLSDVFFGGGAGIRYSIALVGGVLLPGAAAMMLMVRKHYVSASAAAGLV